MEFVEGKVGKPWAGELSGERKPLGHVVSHSM